MRDELMARALLFLAGLVSVVAGVALFSPRVALIVGGVLVAGLATLQERSAARDEAAS